MPSSVFACQPRPVSVCSSAVTSACRWPLATAQQQFCRSGRQVAVRAARFENRELLVGDCTSLLSFCLYKQVAVRLLLPYILLYRKPQDRACRSCTRCRPSFSSQTFPVGWSPCTSVPCALWNLPLLHLQSAAPGWQLLHWWAGMREHALQVVSVTLWTGCTAVWNTS